MLRKKLAVMHQSAVWISANFYHVGISIPSPDLRMVGGDRRDMWLRLWAYPHRDVIWRKGPLGNKGDRKIVTFLINLSRVQNKSWKLSINLMYKMNGDALLLMWFVLLPDVLHLYCCSSESDLRAVWLYRARMCGGIKEHLVFQHDFAILATISTYIYCNCLLQRCYTMPNVLYR